MAPWSGVLQGLYREWVKNNYSLSTVFTLQKPTPPSIMIADYPAAVPAWENSQLEADFAYMSAVVARVRGLRRCAHALIANHYLKLDECRRVAAATAVAPCLDLLCG